jgi:hypothetical protein
MRKKYAVVCWKPMYVAKDAIFGFAFCLGLGLLLKWWEMPSGTFLSEHQVKDAANTAVPIALGMALGELLLHVGRPRSKPTE